jgi:hypothetical protein
MTTLVGIAAKRGKNPGVVMASDLASTRQSWENMGDIAVKVSTQRETQKIWVDKKGELAVSMTGINDPIYTGFLYDLLNGDINFRKSIENGFFEDLLRINLNRFDGRVWQNDSSNSLLISTRYDDEPKLWTCWPLGRVDERDFTAIGSGSDHALRYISEQEILTPKQITTKQAISYAGNAVKTASADIYTAGLDLVVVSADKIRQYGKRIKKRVDDAESDEILNIKREF